MEFCHGSHCEEISFNVLESELHLIACINHNTNPYWMIFFNYKCVQTLLKAVFVGWCDLLVGLSNDSCDYT